MLSPCEVIIWYVLPNIRAELAKELVSDGLTQKEASEILKTTQSAVSFYIGGKRGKGFEFDEGVSREIERLAKRLKEGRSDLIGGICGICTKIKEKKLLCELHREHSVVPEDCNTCLR